MANLEAQPKWSSVRLLEAHELARGGLNGNMNEQAKALAERTEFLNQEKASKLEIIQGVFEFGTFAEFNAAKTSLPANCTVVIGEENKTGTGTWGIGNNRWNGIDLKKSSFDPVIQAKVYTDSSVKKITQSLLQKNTVSPVQYINKHINSSTGVLTDSTLYDCFIFGIVEFGDLYVTTYSTGSTAAPVVFLNASNAVISTPLALLTEYFDEKVTIPANATQVAINFRKAAPTLKTTTLKQDQLSATLANDVKALSATVANQNSYITANTSALSAYIDKALIFVTDYFVSATGVVTAAAGQRYVEVVLGLPKQLKITTKTTNSTVPALVFVDSNGAVISTLAGNQKYTDYLITAPPNAAKVYLNHRQDFSVVPALAVFDVYSDVAKDVIDLKTQASTSKWSGKTWASLGDSITAMATWQAYVNAVHGFVWSNYGIGGTKISGAAGDTNAMCQDTRINAIPTTVDLVTLMGGTNDWAQNVPLGDINSTDPLTFNGALNTFAQKAFKRWPTKRIALTTTPYGEIPAFESRPGWTSPAKNSLGLTTNDYAEAIRNFCKRLNLHCIDVALSAGWGTYNITEALGGSTTDHLHPNSGSNAAKGIGIVHIKAIKDIEPLQ